MWVVIYGLSCNIFAPCIGTDTWFMLLIGCVVSPIWLRTTIIFHIIFPFTVFIFLYLLSLDGIDFGSLVWVLFVSINIIIVRIYQFRACYCICVFIWFNFSQDIFCYSFCHSFEQFIIGGVFSGHGLIFMELILGYSVFIVIFSSILRISDLSSYFLFISSLNILSVILSCSRSF